MRIFATGTGGYLGSLLAVELLRAGHQVVGLDTGFYKASFICPPAASMAWPRPSA